MRLTLDIAIDGESLPVVTWEDQAVACEPEAHEPLRQDQRRALFAAFQAVFGTIECDKRHLFTRMILGRDVDDQTTWGNGGPWHDARGLTAADGSRLLDVLDACERVMCA